MFYDALDYPPTPAELALVTDPAEAQAPRVLTRGRLTLSGREALVEEHETRERLFPRKIRRARKVARFLAGLSGVRFVGLCNTTALAHARDEGDLDFFVITRTGTIMQTRGWATLRYKLTGTRPGTGASDRDAVCLSFFIDDSALDLSPLMLPGDDPYFRYWFLSLLPLFDDGISSELWRANGAILSHHPQARPWIMNEDLRVTRPWWRLPALRPLEPLATRWHGRLISPTLRKMQNLDTRVVVNAHVLKFHADDGRERFRELYRNTLKRYGLAS